MRGDKYLFRSVIYMLLHVHTYIQDRYELVWMEATAEKCQKYRKSLRDHYVRESFLEDTVTHKQ